MTTEVTRRSELAEFVSDHVFSYVNGNKLISVVDSDRLTNEVRRNHTCSRPGLDDRLLIALGLSDYFRLEFRVNEWSFFSVNGSLCYSFNYFFFLEIINFEVVFFGLRVL